MGRASGRRAVLVPEGSARREAVGSEEELYYAHDLLRARAVGDVMTRNPVWVSAHVPVRTAAEVMAASGLGARR